MKLTRRQTLRGLGVTSTIGLAGCGDSRRDANSSATSSAQETTSSEYDSVRAAFVYHDAVGDFGWQWAHDRGRHTIDAAFDWLETEIYDNVSAKGSKTRFAQIAERGFDIIFGTSFDYMGPMDEVAPEYPDVAFENCSGYKQRENMGRYFGRMYEPRYLAGIAAGLLTEADEIGYVAAFPISEVIRGINAFAVGASSVNKDATVRVRYTDTWNDADIESQTAELLIAEGVDVLAQHQNYPAAAETAAAAGIWATGYNSPMGDYVGEKYVTSPIWCWDSFYRRAVREIRADTWEADFYWKGLAAGVVDLSEWGAAVPASIRKTVAQKRTEIASGELEVWAGTKFEEYDDEQLYSDVTSYVGNVAGEVPG